jgi:hypothetical protein
VDIVEFLYLEGCLACDSHGLPFAQQKDRLLVLEHRGQLDTLLLAVGDNLRDAGRELLKFLPDLVDEFDGGTLLLLCDFGGEADEVEHLVEEAFRGSNAGLSAHLDIDGEIHLASKG